MRRLLVFAQRHEDYVRWWNGVGVRAGRNVYASIYGDPDRIRGLGTTNIAIVELSAPGPQYTDVLEMYRAMGMISIDPDDRESIARWLRGPLPWQTVEAIAAYVRSLSPEYEAVADAILSGFVESKPSEQP